MLVDLAHLRISVHSDPLLCGGCVSEWLRVCLVDFMLVPFYGGWGDAIQLPHMLAPSF